jgi:hypothetical protein
VLVAEVGFMEVAFILSKESIVERNKTLKKEKTKREKKKRINKHNIERKPMKNNNNKGCSECKRRISLSSPPFIFLPEN